MRTVFWPLLTLPLLMAATPAPPQVAAGPMVGATEMSETRLWVKTQAPAEVRYRYWPEGQTQQARWSTTATTHTSSSLAATITLTELQPGTRYHYQLYLDNQAVQLPQTLSFSTQPNWRWEKGDPPTFTFAAGSCAYINDPEETPAQQLGGNYEVFQAIAAQKPNAMLWLGDNIYLREPDFFSAARIDRRYHQGRAVPELQPLLSSVAHYATWDDHDYGANDADRTYRLREDSFDLFKRYWANPSYGLPGVPGVFTRFEWGDVEFFLTDNRYHRAPNRYPDPNRDFFGPAQRQWLQESLASSRATFKIIVVGNQMLNCQVRSENAYSYAGEYQGFLDWLAAAKIPGVVLLTGDRHHSELLKLERPGTYPLYELTASPLTSKAYPPFPEEKELDVREPGTLYTERNFALLRVSGPRQQRTLTLAIHDVKGQPVWQRILKEQELR